MHSPRARSAGIALAIALFAVAPPTAAPQTHGVTRVVDGDTVVLETIGAVRLIGIDTPEIVDPRVPVQAFGLEASAALKTLLVGQRVRLEYDLAMLRWKTLRQPATVYW